MIDFKSKEDCFIPLFKILVLIFNVIFLLSTALTMFVRWKNKSILIAEGIKQNEINILLKHGAWHIVDDQH